MLNQLCWPTVIIWRVSTVKAGSKSSRGYKWTIWVENAPQMASSHELLREYFKQEKPNEQREKKRVIQWNYTVVITVYRDICGEMGLVALKWKEEIPKVMENRAKMCWGDTQNHGLLWYILGLNFHYCGTICGNDFWWCRTTFEWLFFCLFLSKVLNICYHQNHPGHQSNLCQVGKLCLDPFGKNI